MFSSTQLSPEQKDALHQWAAAGATMADLQRHLKEEYSISLTYMDTRLLVLDLGIELLEEPKPAEPVADSVALAPTPTGKVTTSLDHITVPGALASGKATFADGESAAWMLDQSGRLRLIPDTAGYRPAEADAIDFQNQLEDLLRKSGY